jgi:hypothetical protein
MLHMSHVEQMSQDMLFDLERELANALGSNPVSVTTAALPAGGTELSVVSTVGFPPGGAFVIERGTAREEVIAYTSLEDTTEIFLDLVRGQECTAPVDHEVQSELLWTGLAEPLDEQPPAAAQAYDGIALEHQGELYFRGLGTGFSYRVPVIAPGSSSYVVGDDVAWGASVPGAPPTTDGWNAIYFQPRALFDESVHADDVNLDGDTADVFDVGQLRKVVWNVADAAQPPSYLGLGPTAVLQERCNHGGDLDGDGYGDPMFLWDAKNNVLHVRLFLIGLSDADAPVTRMVESVMFLRNELEIEPEM